MIDTDNIPMGALGVVVLLVSAAVLMPTTLGPPPGENATNGTVTDGQTAQTAPANIPDKLFNVPESHTETAGGADAP